MYRHHTQLFVGVAAMLNALALCAQTEVRQLAPLSVVAGPSPGAAVTTELIATETVILSAVAGMRAPSWEKAREIHSRISPRSFDRQRGTLDRYRPHQGPVFDRGS